MLPSLFCSFGAEDGDLTRWDFIAEFQDGGWVAGSPCLVCHLQAFMWRTWWHSRTPNQVLVLKTLEHLCWLFTSLHLRHLTLYPATPLILTKSLSMSYRFEPISSTKCRSHGEVLAMDMVSVQVYQPGLRPCVQPTQQDKGGFGHAHLMEGLVVPNPSSHSSSPSVSIQITLEQ